MASNPYTGETKITIGGQECSLVFDWKALAAIHAQLGPDAVRNTLNKEAIWKQSPDVYVKMIHIGLARHHPDMTLEQVMDGLPPFAQTLTIITEALLVGYFGKDDPLPADSEPADDSKKN